MVKIKCLLLLLLSALSACTKKTALGAYGKNTSGIELQLSEAETVELMIETFDNTGFTILWNDSTHTHVNSSEQISHTFSTPHSGKILLKDLDGHQIKRVLLIGGFSFDIQQLYEFAPKIESLVMKQGIRCYGDVARKPKSLVYIDLQTGDFYGNFTKKRLEKVKRLRVVHGNSITFDIAHFDTSIEYIGVTGNNTATGLLDSLNYPLLHHFDLKGKNTVSGDLGKITTSIPTLFYLGGNNTVHSYTPGNLHFSSPPKIFILSNSTSTSLSTKNIDDLLIDLDKASTVWKEAGLLILTGTQGAPSATSSAAVSSLQSKGAKVCTN